MGTLTFLCVSFPWISFEKSRPHTLVASFMYACFIVSLEIDLIKGNANFAAIVLPSIEDKSSCFFNVSKKYVESDFESLARL